MRQHNSAGGQQVSCEQDLVVPAAVAQRVLPLKAEELFLGINKPPSLGECVKSMALALKLSKVP